MYVSLSRSLFLSDMYICIYTYTQNIFNKPALRHPRPRGRQGLLPRARAFVFLARSLFRSLSLSLFSLSLFSLSSLSLLSLSLIYIFTHTYPNTVFESAHRHPRPRGRGGLLPRTRARRHSQPVCRVSNAPLERTCSQSDQTHLWLWQSQRRLALALRPLALLPRLRVCSKRAPRVISCVLT